jgi:hypothetical protein
MRGELHWASCLQIPTPKPKKGGDPEKGEGDKRRMKVGGRRGDKIEEKTE